MLASKKTDEVRGGAEEVEAAEGEGVSVRDGGGGCYCCYCCDGDNRLLGGGGDFAPLK